MKKDISNVIDNMITYYKGDKKRINHFLKVYSFCKTIGELENLDDKTQYILEIAGVTHDIGIKISEEKYNSSNGKYQEIEGPIVAKGMLEDLDIDSSVIDRICFLIGHHHTYNKIDNIDYQILVEADFLVNIDEDSMGKDEIATVKNKYFKTKSGIRFLENMYE